MNAEFKNVFAQLRQLLQGRAGTLEVTADTQDHYCLTLPFSPMFKKSFPAAWVKIEKNYVAYHFMPVYMFPKLREQMSSELKKRMQGKSCFNFKAVDTALFKELGELTTEGFAMCRKTGVAP